MRIPVLLSHNSNRAIYNLHYGGNGLKYQILVFPDGLIIDCHGPYGGRDNDVFILRASGLDDRLQSLCDDGDDPWFVYGDPAYTFTGARYIIGPFRVANPSPEQEHFNKTMSKVRVSVENAIGTVTNKWCALDFTRQEKIGWSAIALKYKVAVILSNFITCIRGGNQVSVMFQITPPSLGAFLKVDRN